MNPETVSTTRETIPPLFFCVSLLLRLEDEDFPELPVFARPVAALLDDFVVADLERDELLLELVDVARPFLLEVPRDEPDRDFDAEPFPDRADLAFDEDDFALEDEPELPDRDRDDDDFAPDDPDERELLADFARLDELLDEEELFDPDELPELDELLDLDEADFAPLFFAEPDLEELDREAPLFEPEEEDLEDPFFAVDPLPDLELFEPDLELEDFFAVAIFASLFG